MSKPAENFTQANGRQYARRADWEMIETAYRLNKTSSCAIAAAHNISEGAIRKRAKAENWTRDLGTRVRIRSDSMVRKASTAVFERSQPADAPPSKLTGDVLEVEIEALVQARIRISHRADIARSRKMAMVLLEELEKPTNPLGFVPSVGALKSLSDSLRTLVELERKAYGLDDVVVASLSFEDRLKALANG